MFYYIYKWALWYIILNKTKMRTAVWGLLCDRATLGWQFLVSQTGGLEKNIVENKESLCNGDIATVVWSVSLSWWFQDEVLCRITFLVSLLWEWHIVPGWWGLTKSVKQVTGRAWKLKPGYISIFVIFFMYIIRNMPTLVWCKYIQTLYRD